MYKPANQFVEWYCSVASCAMNMESLISKNCFKFGNEEISEVFYCTFYWLLAHSVCSRYVCDQS
jgi:hypothetical protein